MAAVILYYINITTHVYLVSIFFSAKQPQPIQSLRWDDSFKQFNEPEVLELIKNSSLESAIGHPKPFVIGWSM